MLKLYNKEQIINNLASILTYGIDECYSFKSIQERLIKSNFINNLENEIYNEYLTDTDLIWDVFNINSNIKYVNTRFKHLYFANTYINIFFKFQKSFEFMFLYLPLSLLDEKYDVYHEMDDSQIYEYFNRLINEETLLRKLSKEKSLSLINISNLTNISIDTLKRYSLNNKHLYSASSSNIYKLSRLLNVKYNIFIESIDIYLDSSIYKFTYKNGSHLKNLGFNYSKYYDPMFNKDNPNLVVKRIDNNDFDINEIKKDVSENDYLIIFHAGNYFHTLSEYKELKKIKCIEIMVITNENVFMIKKGVHRDIKTYISNYILLNTYKFDNDTLKK